MWQSVNLFAISLNLAMPDVAKKRIDIWELPKINK